ncbi:aminoacyl-histidine dipeptidase [Mobilitalea sibirica]|uniref:Cytosol non-specific dipeptidase n=1 Tax=Mobilitalea sibirica TaxID=1462919 RepID=A0A8J7GXB2_9FIRM|nr:aminoacyl-histidine dipeptidase [Mobilitalea sibirica]MBH1939759.1 aminoacyl-histidine dipeptidase [Mobilitalea sibirica]
MNKSLEQLDYKGIFKYFTEISKIPRGSGNEGEISKYLVTFAKTHNLEYTQDEAKNVIMIKEASPGYEDEPAILLQGHMDMVCEKLKDSTHDFLKDEIKLIVDGDFLHADGTTLGGDNGIAVAYILALFSDETLPHPRLEAVITTDEEVGMLGAKELDLSGLKAKYMINMDSGEEGYLLASCAGGLTGTCYLPINRITEYGKKIKVSIGGLIGGHSGMDIVKNRSNANKVMGRLLFDLRESEQFGIIHMEGGFKDNVIPREAYGELLVTVDETTNNSKDEKALTEAYLKIKSRIDELTKAYQHELSGSEPDLKITVEDLGDGEYPMLHPVSFEKVLFMLVNMPYGVQVMSSHIEGLVESSLNLGIFRLEEDKAIFCNSVRSSIGNYKHYISNRLNYLVSFLGGDYEVRSEYPAWEYKKESPLRNHLNRIYKELYGKEMKVEAIHAGLECGFFHEKMPGIDIVSIGPELYRIHTIEERLSISSAIRVYKFVETVLKEKIGDL